MIQYQQIIKSVGCAVGWVSKVAPSNSASLKVEKVAVRPSMVAMKRCWLEMMSTASPYLECGCSAFGSVGVCPLKAKVTRSNRVGCAIFSYFSAGYAKLELCVI